MKANGEVQTREEATEKWVYLPLDHRSKFTSHQKGQENELQYFELSIIRGSWFISEFFLTYIFTYLFIIFITGVNIG